MDDISSREELNESVNNIIDFLAEHEDEFYVPLEVAHQLRDEISQILSENNTDE